MLYIIIAKDGTDEGALERRHKVRDAHLEAIKPAVESGFVQLGGAILNDAGDMTGSVMLLDAASEEEARAFVENDLYTTGGVWQSFEIYPFKRAV